MGVIKRQGIKNSFISAFGVFIGAISTIAIYPLSFEVVGLARFLIDTATLLVPFAMLGANALVIRFFPHFKDNEKKHNGFLGNILAISLLGMLLFSVVYFLFQTSLQEIYSDKLLIKEYLLFIVPLTCIIGFNELLTQYISNFQRIVIPGIFNLFIKIVLPVLVLFSYYKIIGIDTVVNGILLNFSLVLLLLLFYLRSLGHLHLRPDFSKWDKKVRKEMKTFVGYGVLGLLGAMFATRIDSTMIGSLLNERSVGIYSILLFMTNVIDIPRISIEKIAGPIISEAWKNNDLEEIENLYKKTSINQLVIGLLLFIGIYANLDSLFSLMPKGEVFAEYKSVILFLGAAKLLNMASGINHHIIAYSEHFRLNFYTLIIMAVMNVVLNLYFIPKFGIIGAALATLCSLSFFNLLKYVLLLRLIKIQPFTKKTLLALVIGVGVFYLATSIPPIENRYIDIAIRSAGISLLFGGLIILGKVSEDINGMYSQILKRVFKRS